MRRANSSNLSNTLVRRDRVQQLPKLYQLATEKYRSAPDRPLSPNKAEKTSTGNRQIDRKSRDKLPERSKLMIEKMTSPRRTEAKNSPKISRSVDIRPEKPKSDENDEPHHSKSSDKIKLTYSSPNHLLIIKFDSTDEEDPKVNKKLSPRQRRKKSGVDHSYIPRLKKSGSLSKMEPKIKKRESE